MYQNGKIYKIICNLTDLIYVGSTTKKLYERLKFHESSYKRYIKIGRIGPTYSSYQIMRGGDYYIELIENVACNSRKELEKREGHYIRSLDCLNRSIAGRTRREYNHDNRDKISRYYAEKNNQIIPCGCGGSYKYTTKTGHDRTINHRLFMV